MNDLLEMSDFEAMRREVLAMRREMRDLTEAAFYQEIDVREVARLRQCSEESVRVACRDGLLPFIPGSKPYRFIKADIILHRDRCSLRRLEASARRLEESA